GFQNVAKVQGSNVRAPFFLGAPQTLCEFRTKTNLLVSPCFQSWVCQSVFRYSRTYLLHDVAYVSPHRNPITPHPYLSLLEWCKTFFLNFNYLKSILYILQETFLCNYFQRCTFRN